MDVHPILLSAPGRPDVGGAVDPERFIELSPDLFVALWQGLPVALNHAWTETLGWELDELTGDQMRDLIHPDDLAAIVGEIARVMHEGGKGATRGRYRHKDGSWRWMDWAGALDPQSQLMYCLARDVTDQVAEAELRDQLLTVLQENSAMLADQTLELDNLREEAERLARFDTLTGLLNRRAWFESIKHARPVALALADVDHFKHVNDTYGHPVGDAALAEVASRMSEAAGDEAIVGRVGGEEFAIGFAGGLEDAIAVCHRIRRAVESLPVGVSGLSLPLTISIGLSPWRTGRLTREDALAKTYEHADRALYDAKHAGRNRVVFDSGRRAA